MTATCTHGLRLNLHRCSRADTSGPWDRACVQGAFYNPHAVLDAREKHEKRADKWAIEALIPADDLEQAIADGYTEIWSLAEHFNVTEDFMKKAVCWHLHGTLETELYFLPGNC